METKNVADFHEVAIRQRKDFQFDVATPLEKNEPECVMNMLWNLLGKVDMDIYCLLEFDIKARLIREITYMPRTFRNALRHPENLLRQAILDKPHNVIMVHLTGYDFPKYINWDQKATEFMKKEEEAAQQLGALFKLANIVLRDYIVSDYTMKRHFPFSEKELLAVSNDFFEQYLGYSKPLAGMEVKSAPVAVKKYDSRYPAEIAPSWHYSGNDVRTPADAIFAVRELIQDSDREIAGTINLDGWNPLNFQLSAMGNSYTTAVDSGLLLRSTLLSNANAIILFHNHPSGDVDPSISDIMLTEKVRCLCDKCGIAMMDHVIIGFNNDFCYSFYRDSIFDAEHKESPFRSIAESVRETIPEDIESNLKYDSEHRNSGHLENIAAERAYPAKNHHPRR